MDGFEIDVTEERKELEKALATAGKGKRARRRNQVMPQEVLEPLLPRFLQTVGRLMSEDVPFTEQAKGAELFARYYFGNPRFIKSLVEELTEAADGATGNSGDWEAFVGLAVRRVREEVPERVLEVDTQERVEE